MIAWLKKLKERWGFKFEIWGGRGDQNSEKHLKLYKVVKLQKISYNNIKM